MGPQQFDLSVYETYQTKDPAAPITGTEIEGTVTVTINWNLAGTELTDKDVQYSDILWTGAGNGPLTVYDDALGGGMKAIGTVEWHAKTHTIKVVETETPNKQVRWAITPVVELVRTFKSTVGDPDDTGVTYTASDTVRGAWMPQPTT
jgi:hypothetical protein